MPTPSSAGPQGWFAHGAPPTIPYTILTSDWANAVQAELINTIQAAGLVPDKTNQSQLLAAIRVLNGQTVCQAPLTLNVAPSGSDNTGDGTSGKPFLTIQKAWNTLITGYNLNGYAATIQVANGTYTTGVNLVGTPTGYIGQGITIQGNNTTPSACLINVANGNCFAANYCGSVYVTGFKMMAGGISTNFTVSGVCLWAGIGTFIVYHHCDFGASTSSHVSAVAAGTATSLGQPYTISGGAPCHVDTINSGQITTVNSTITLTGTPAFTAAFARAQVGSGISIWSTSFVGAATGPRYAANWGGLINTNGAGANYLPGNVAGTTTNGWYI
jgi:hypothetical protein